MPSDTHSPYPDNSNRTSTSVSSPLVTNGDATSADATSPPAGKVKASFNLLREDIDSLRAMARLLGTTVTYVLQRSIRDERFIQDQLAEGNRFAIVDRKGTTREIIWR